MHFKKLFALVIISLSLTQAYAAKSAPTVRALNDKAFASLKKDLAAEKNFEARIKLLNSFEAKMAEIRGANKRQDEDDEIYLDQLAEGLKLIPRSNISKDDCESKQTEILFTFEPTATNKKAKQPGVAKALEVLNLVGRCEAISKK